MMRRRAEFRPFGWLHDLWKRGQLDLDPPYQRRSVWSDKYKADFVITVLLNYPCPAIFLFEEIRPDGSFLYKVVDGKQRLTTLFDFVSNKIAIPSDFPQAALQDKYFEDLPDNMKLEVWRYLFAIEFIEQENETVINDIFNRLNKNVSRLTHQELRHARFSGLFLRHAEELAAYMYINLEDFPRITPQARRQMKDVENVALLLLFIEQGERSTSQIDLDKAFSERDDDWLSEFETVELFKESISYIKNVIVKDATQTVVNSRLRNQADFYSFFGAIVELKREGSLPPPMSAAQHLVDFVSKLNVSDEGRGDKADIQYLNAARSASNDAGPRRVRIDRLKEAILGH